MAMSLAFNLALHVLLVGSLLIFLVGIAASSLSEPDPRERLLRIAAIVAGAMVTLGAQAAGVDYASFTVNALAGARPASAAAQIGAALIPALLGAGLGFYIVRVFRRSERIAMRIMGFVGMLAATAFLQIYAQATHTNGVFLGAASLPNVSFVTGIILCVVFTYDPERKGTGASAVLLKRFLQRKSTDGAPASMLSSLFPSQSSAEEHRGKRRDPFAR
jgi:hypothetical protein